MTIIEKRMIYIIDKSSSRLREIIRKFIINIRDFRFRFIISAFKWCTTSEQFIAKYTYTPIIHLILILFMTDDFRCEIIQCSTSSCIPKQFLVEDRFLPSLKTHIVSAWRIFVDQPKSASFKLPQQSTRTTKNVHCFGWRISPFNLYCFPVLNLDG